MKWSLILCLSKYIDIFAEFSIKVQSFDSTVGKKMKLSVLHIILSIIFCPYMLNIESQVREILSEHFSLFNLNEFVKLPKWRYILGTTKLRNRHQFWSVESFSVDFLEILNILFIYIYKTWLQYKL